MSKPKFTFGGLVAACLLRGSFCARDEDQNPEDLCEEEVVTEACRGFHDWARDRETRNSTTVTEIVARSSATEPSVRALWGALSPPLPEEVECMELCQKVAAFLGVEMLPDGIDQACYLDGSLQKVCFDVGAKQLAGLFKDKKDLPDFGDVKEGHLNHAQAESHDSASPTQGDSPQYGLEYDLWQMAAWVARSFRIFPVNGMTPAGKTPAGEGHFSGLGSKSSVLSLFTASSSAKRRGTSNGGDGPCGDMCQEQSDCQFEDCAGCTGEQVDGIKRADCQQRSERGGGPGSRHPLPGAGGTGSGRPPPGSLGLALVGHHLGGGGEGNNAWSRLVQKEHNGCVPGFCTDRVSPLLCTNYPKTCGNCEYCNDTVSNLPEIQPTAPAQTVNNNVQKTRPEIIGEVRVMAEAYLQNAINLFNQKHTETLVKNWFGNKAHTAAESQNQISHVLNSAQLVLSNSVFLIDDGAGERTYAYVYPRSAHRTKNSEGKYQVFLCPLFFRSELSVQIETLTHEATHHAVAYTNDVCADNIDNINVKRRTGLVSTKKFSNSLPGDRISWDNYNAQVLFTVPSRGAHMVELDSPRQCTMTAYGRSVCLKLAQNVFALALANADNYCYFIQDATDVKG